MWQWCKAHSHTPTELERDRLWVILCLSIYLCVCTPVCVTAVDPTTRRSQRRGFHLLSTVCLTLPPALSICLGASQTAFNSLHSTLLLTRAHRVLFHLFLCGGGDCPITCLSSAWGINVITLFTNPQTNSESQWRYCPRADETQCKPMGRCLLWFQYEIGRVLVQCIR